MFANGQGLTIKVLNFGNFSNLHRALTLGGLAPAVLLGCGVHGNLEGLINYKVAMLVPTALAAPSKFDAPVPQELVSSLGGLTRSFGGVVGVAVTSIDDGWVVQSGGERKLPQQSVSKLWVTMTVLDAVDQGKIRLSDPITVTKADFTVFHQPIASLVKDEFGYTTTVGELMRRAMTMSDNTCNDKLLRLVGGPDAVRDFMRRKGFGPIRFGPGEKLLQAGTAGLQWRPEYSMGNSFAVARAQLSPAVREAAFNAYVADPPDGAAPLAISAALARLKRGEVLSPASTAWLIATMQDSHTGKQRMRGAVPPGWQFGHKTGTGQDLRGHTAGYNDVGILTAPDGRSYALAVMIGDSARPIRERQLLMQSVVSAIVAHHASL